MAALKSYKDLDQELNRALNDATDIQNNIKIIDDYDTKKFDLQGILDPELNGSEARLHDLARELSNDARNDAQRALAARLLSDIGTINGKLGSAAAAEAASSWTAAIMDLAGIGKLSKAMDLLGLAFETEGVGALVVLAQAVIDQSNALRRIKKQAKRDLQYLADHQTSYDAAKFFFSQRGIADTPQARQQALADAEKRDAILEDSLETARQNLQNAEAALKPCSTQALQRPPQDFAQCGNSSTTVAAEVDDRDDLMMMAEVPAFDQTSPGQCTIPTTRASSWGDPHVVTPDFAHYDFQQVGEWVMARSNLDDFELQVRQRPWGQFSRIVAENSAIAAHVAGHRVGVYVTNPGVQIQIDDQIATPGSSPTALPGGGTISNNQNTDQATVTWPNGSFVIADYSRGHSLDLAVGIANSERGHLTGLLGNFEGNPANDFTTRSGQVLPNPPTTQQLYGPFSKGWRLKHAESLFHYGPGETTDTFTDLNFPYGPASLASLPAGVVTSSAAICQQSGVSSEPFLDACILDLGETGDLGTVGASVGVQAFQTSSSAITPTPTATPSPTVTPTPRPTSSPTTTPTAQPTSTITPTPLPTTTLACIATATPTATPTGGSGLTTRAVVHYCDSFKYQVVPFDGIQGFQLLGFDDSSWPTGQSAFGNNLGCPLTAQTFWPGNDDLLLRKAFSLPLGAVNLRVSVAIDNDIQVFLNGTDISGGLVLHGGCATRDSFVFQAPDSLLLDGGTNLLAVRARDTGSVSYVDLQVQVDAP